MRTYVILVGVLGFVGLAASCSTNLAGGCFDAGGPPPDSCGVAQIGLSCLAYDDTRSCLCGADQTWECSNNFSIANGAGGFGSTGTGNPSLSGPTSSGNGPTSSSGNGPTSSSGNPTLSGPVSSSGTGTMNCGSVLSGEPPACESCGEYYCCAEAAACDLGTPCGDYLDCYFGCGGNTACEDACASTFSNGIPDYQLFAGCVNDNCTTECPGSGAICDSGLQVSEAACNACLTNNCCTEFVDCANDTNCFACVTGDPSGVNCDSDPLQTAAFDCRENFCGSLCAAGICDTGLSYNVAACDSCLTNNCCTQYTNCVNDPSCLACLTGSGPSGCEATGLPKTTLDCQAASCGTACM